MEENEVKNEGKIKKYFSLVGNFLYKIRYLIGIIILIICVCNEISGSSIGAWNTYVDIGKKDKGIIFGESRGLRSDEWGVTTPFIFSQITTGFNWFTGVLRGGNTEAFTIYGLPIMKIIQIYRPFQLGYLLWGASKGLSFFWCARLILLLLITFDFNMIITKKNKLLSFIGTMLLTFSPQVQWWFATNGMAELFIFGQLAIIALFHYLNTNKFIIRTLCLGGILFSAGVYLLILYPAYQIPLFFVFLFLAIWVIKENYKNCKIKKIDILLIVLGTILFLLSIAYTFYGARDTIKVLLNTAYPGKRIETGGGALPKYISYIQNVFFPFFTYDFTENNVCEEAMMFGLFPLGLIVTVINYIRTKKKDLLTLLLIIPYAFIGIYCIFGLPGIIAKITLMSHSTASRALIALGYIDILILIISLSQMEKSVKWWKALIISAVTSLILVIATKFLNSEHITNLMALLLLAICIPIFYCILRFKSKAHKIILTILIIALVGVAGMTVNPIRQGISIITDSQLIEKFQAINNEEPGIWIGVGLDFKMMPNYIAMAGVPTLNCTNAYPNVELWKQIDTNSEYEDIYNRYAHIKMDLVKTEEDRDKKFELIADPDVIKVTVTVDELKLLNVKYIFVPRNLEQYNNENVTFEIIDKYDSYCIYKVNYNN